MSDKDFLSKIADEAAANKKPDSFKEEVRVPVHKEKKPIKPVYIIASVVALIVAAIVVYFVAFSAKIEMPNFVGKTKQEVGQWVTQQGIEATGLVFNEEYNFDFEDGQIISQSIEAGKKVKDNVKLNFTISKGADPEEEIELPDIANMTKEELKDWESENKILKMKITTSYNETVEKDNVISFNVKGCEADSFTRGCALNISVSKGPQPAGVIKVEKFVGKNVEEVKAWAERYKVVLNVVDVFSDEKPVGEVLTQSVKENETLADKQELTITVSKGKGVKVPNFANMSNQEVDQWLDENASVVDVTKKYFDSTKHVISQSVGANGMVSSEDPLKITINLGNTFYLSDELVNGTGVVKNGVYYDKLVDFCNNIRYLGIDSYAGQWNENTEVYSEEYYKGQVVSIEVSSYSTGEKFSLNDRLPLDVRFSVIVSKGKIYTIDNKANEDGGRPLSDSSNIFVTTKVVDILASNGIPFDNQATGESCDLYIDGEPVSTTLDSIKYIEGQKVELKNHA